MSFPNGLSLCPFISIISLGVKAIKTGYSPWLFPLSYLSQLSVTRLTLFLPLNISQVSLTSHPITDIILVEAIILLLPIFPLHSVNKIFQAQIRPLNQSMLHIVVWEILPKRNSDPSPCLQNMLDVFDLVYTYLSSTLRLTSHLSLSISLCTLYFWAQKTIFISLNLSWSWISYVKCLMSHSWPHSLLF